MIVVYAIDRPPSAIISTRSRKLSLKRKYHLTHNTMISRSKCRPPNSSSKPGNPAIAPPSARQTAGRIGRSANCTRAFCHIAHRKSVDEKPEQSSPESLIVTYNTKDYGNPQNSQPPKCVA